MAWQGEPSVAAVPAAVAPPVARAKNSSTRRLPIMEPQPPPLNAGHERGLSDEYEKLDACPVCDAKQYKIRQNDSGDVDGEPAKKKVSAKCSPPFPPDEIDPSDRPPVDAATAVLLHVALASLCRQTLCHHPRRAICAALHRSRPFAPPPPTLSLRAPPHVVVPSGAGLLHARNDLRRSCAALLRASGHSPASSAPSSSAPPPPRRPPIDVVVLRARLVVPPPAPPPRPPRRRAD
ncbi:formin-like protein 5 [Panicum virgatum]|uniref:formin-like protein 5 n=1 Tax=Panicum virgatum TaxID=38727 RepID=UPI0019D57ED0|nr:formin-like protein 5 [Panicum virgatum]